MNRLTSIIQLGILLNLYFHDKFISSSTWIYMVTHVMNILIEQTQELSRLCFVHSHIEFLKHSKCMLRN